MVLASLTCLLAAGRAPADTVILDNGKRLEGRVTEEGEYVVLEMEYGTLKIPRAKVRSIIRQRTALDEYAERLNALRQRIPQEKLAAKEAGQAWCELAAWCGEQRLPRSRLDCFRSAVEADPDCAAAREALGFSRVGNAWLTGPQRNEALGLVRHEGKWVTPEAAADAKAAAEEARQREQKRADDEVGRRLKEAEAKRAEAEEQLAKERARREEDAARTAPYWFGPRGYPSPYFWYWPPVIITPPAPQPRPHPAPGPKDATDEPTTASPLNNGRSGPGFPLLH